MSGTLFTNVEVEGIRVDVRYCDGAIREVGAGLPSHGEEIVDGQGGVLLPGLHDHHLHLLALAASLRSVDCSDSLEPLRSAQGRGWIRGVGTSHSVDRHALDRLVPARPVRVQHRSGALWMLNTAALGEVAAILDDHPGIERDDQGEPTGRLWRLDDRLREALPPDDLADGLRAVADDLVAHGITSVTDATPDLDPSAIDLLSGFPLSVTMLGDCDASAAEKILIHDHKLPRYDDLVDRVRSARDRDHAVALHVVTRASLALALAVLDDVGRRPGDRIEHGAVIPDPRPLAGLCIVTQPGFIHVRGDDYVAEVDKHDQPFLYRYQTLLDSGLSVLPSSDAPFGPLDPWLVIRSAAERTTRTGQPVGVPERVHPSAALDGYLCDGSGQRRRVAPGQRTPVLLLDVPLARALTELERSHVRGVWGARKITD